MRLSFLDRDEEQERLLRLLEGSRGCLGVLYGRRRCGKSRLLLEVASRGRSVYYVGDDREGALQRSGLATEISRFLPGFDRVAYPEWDALFARWWEQAQPGMVLILDEFPALVSAAPEIPSLLQRYVDRHQDRGVHLLLAGSSQTMMQGLVLDRSAPLYGRAREILRISPLNPHWICRGLGERDAVKALEAYSVWGGIPRYWELAADHADLVSAVRDVVLSPLGVLHEEPFRLLLDDLRDTAQAASVLSLIGQGCHRLSEIAARLEKPATSLSRPLGRLTDLGFVRREIPFGAPRRGGKKSYYQISDPFLRFWFRFVEPNRSLLEARRVDVVLAEVLQRFPHHAGEMWEELARAATPLLDCFGKSWRTAHRWWGTGTDGKPMEIDLVAESTDRCALLLGEVKWRQEADGSRLLQELETKVRRCPFLKGRRVYLSLWTKTPVRTARSARAFHPKKVLDVLR